MKISSHSITAAIKRGIGPADPRFASFVTREEDRHRQGINEFLVKARLFGFQEAGRWMSLEAWESARGRRAGVSGAGYAEIIEWERGSMLCLELRGPHAAALYQVLPQTLRRIA